MTKNKKILTLVIGSLLLLGSSSLALTTSSYDEAPEVKVYKQNKDQELFNSKAYKKVEKTWAKAEDKFELKNLASYEKFDYLHKSELFNGMTLEEEDKYAEAITSAVNSVRQEGDYLPVIYAKPDKSETIILFQRDNNKVVKVVLEEQSNSNKNALRSSDNNQSDREWEITSTEEK